MVDSMLFFSKYYKIHQLRSKGLPRHMARLLVTWLAISAFFAGIASADETIIVIPTVNSDVQSHAALTVGSRLSRSGFHVTPT